MPSLRFVSELACQGHGLVLAWPVRLDAGGVWSVEITAGLAGRR